MKKSIFFAAVAAFMLMSVSASAQFVQSKGGSKAAASATVEDVFNTFDITYSPVKIKTSYKNNSAVTDLNGVSLNWSQARVLTNQLPVYIQYGAGLQYTWKTDSEDYYKSTDHFLTVKVPVNVLYNFVIPNTAVSIMPYVGLNAQVHALGQSKITYDLGDGEKEVAKFSYFSKEDMDDEPYSRFVLGWQIGGMVAFNRYFVGVGYNGPITNLYKEGDAKINHSQVNISLGIKF